MDRVLSFCSQETGIKSVNGTITDNVTLLVWQKQDDNTTRQWNAANTYCASLSLAGTGWRLPTPFELVTIADYGKSSPAINTIFTSTKSLFYWSTETALTTTDAWIGDFSSGSMVAGGKAASGYARCVRGGNFVSIFNDNGNGTVTDTVKNLMWQKCSYGQNNDATCSGTAGTYTWEQAISYCEGLSLGGSSDWRLPNVKELSSIEDFTKYPVSNLTYFPATQQSYYWSSTTDTSAGTNAWQVSFLGGSVGDTTPKTNSNYVRCVRGQ